MEPVLPTSDRSATTPGWGGARAGLGGMFAAWVCGLPFAHVLAMPEELCTGLLLGLGAGIRKLASDRGWWPL